MTENKKYGYCGGKVLKDGGEIKYTTGGAPVLKISLLNEEFMSGAGKYTEVAIWGDDKDLVEIESSLSKFDLVLVNGTVKEGSYDSKKTPGEKVKTYTLNCYANQVVVFDSGSKDRASKVKYPVNLGVVGQDESPF